MKKGTFYGWTIVAASFIVLCITFGVQQTFSVYFKPILSEFGWDRTQISLALSISMIVSACLLPVIGKLVTKYGPKKIILVSIPIVGLSTILFSMISTLWQYYLLYALGGLGFSGAGLIPNTVLVSKWFQKKRATAMSIFMSGYPLSQIVLTPFSTYLVSVYGWRTSYVIYGSLFFAIALPIVMILVKDDPKELGLEIDGEPTLNQPKVVKTSTEVSIVDVLKTRSFQLLIAVYFLCGFTDIPVTTHLVPFVLDTGFSVTTASNVLSLIGVFILFGTIISGPISDKFGRKNLITSMYIIRAFSILLLLGTPNLIRLYAFTIPFGLVYFSMVPIIGAWLSDSYGQLSLGKLNGIIALIHSSAASIGAIFLGFTYDLQESYYWGLVLFIILSCIASLFAYFMKE
ncbi:MAG: MFS transporter [Candidatus Bathyarchaeota archaeon]|nr:MAG: MFS transporter [Candidatus Bathyarchaeota archaeon]